MSDNKNQRGPQDRSKVNVNEPYEVSYWTGKFNCTAEQLKQAVNDVGTSASAVEKKLKAAS